jgi:hypothetical protein|uniref:Uncharacterized protein n=1 Tax=Siphoviridae sp. ctksc2 TaxID=2825645 RepID=A0A8S5US06_9CAUD|nr:MAG TPA: protein of unknown function (DUF746) [Siphoviridae sp. ctksc2]
MSAETERPSLLELGVLCEEVRHLCEVLDETEDRRRAVAVAAVRGGASKTAVAAAAGVTRQTLDRWLGVWQRTS